MFCLISCHAAFVYADPTAFGLLIGVTGSGWGASGPYGMWFGKGMMVLGVTVQNFGIQFGAMFYLMSAGKLKDTFVNYIGTEVPSF